jgi:anti-sigma factor RsiW
MSCKDTIHLICWYLEGRLSTSVASEIKRHLETCSDCHLVLDAAINTLDRYFSSERAAGAEAALPAA